MGEYLCLRSFLCHSGQRWELGSLAKLRMLVLVHFQ